MHRTLDALAGASAGGELHQERHLDRLAVEEDAVLLFAVVAEALAVIGEQDDEGSVVEPEPAQAIEERAHRGIRGRHLAVVGIGVRGAPRLGRLVGGVRLVQVEEEEDRTPRRRAQVLERDGDRLRTGPLELPQGLLGCAPRCRRPRRSKPAAIPVLPRSTYADTAPAVAYPRSRSSRASVGTDSPSSR